MFDFIDKTLKEQGLNPLTNGVTKKTSTPSAKHIAESTSSNKIKESELSFLELDQLIEGAIKETANNVIMESMVLEDSQKLVQTKAISKANVEEQFVTDFLEGTIMPVVDTVGTLTEDARLLHTVKNPNSVKGVSLPVYEVALTLESARRGALTEDSLNFTLPVKEDVDPTIMDLQGASAEANALNGEVDEDEQDLADLVDQDECDTYDMGETAVKENYDAHDNHQYQDNDSKMYELEKGKEPSQNGMFEDDPDYDSVSDIEDYEGDPAADPNDGGNFPDRVMPVAETAAQRLARYMFAEDCDTTTKVEYVPSSDSNIEDYEGQEAGLEGDGAEDEDEFEGGPSSDEAIIESQIQITKEILGHIFHEYGITSQAKKKAIVREAIHYIFRYGATNLFPATSDVANLVVEQNNISLISGQYSSKQIVEGTAPVLTSVQEASIQGKSSEYLYALATSRELTRDDEGRDEENGSNHTRDVLDESVVMQAVKFVTTTSLIERTRQAFRCRLHYFNEDVKAKVSDNWLLVESNTSNVATELKENITIREFVTEAANMKKYFAILKEDSPVYKPSWKKANLNNDALTTACLFTEVVSHWVKLKDTLYNGHSLESKAFALESMSTIHETYLNLCSAMEDSSKAKSMIQNHAFRLQNLREKVELALSNKNA